MKSKKLARALSFLLTVCLLLAGPTGAQRAEAFPGVATIAMGAGAGGATALGVGAVLGAVGLGTAAIGLPGLALVGGAVGAIVTTMMGNDDGSRTGEAMGLGALAAGASAGLLGMGGFLFSPWVLLPAAAVGIGVLAWKYAQKPNTWGGPGDIRSLGGGNSTFFSPTARLANRSSTGLYGDDQGVLSKIRGIFDRNRRDDNFLAGSQVNPDGTLRSRNDLFGRAALWLNGTTNTGQYGGGYQFYGPGYGNAGYFAPGSRPRTDRMGQLNVGVGQGRVGLSSSFASVDAGGGVSAPTASDLSALQKARDEAYQELVGALGAGGDSDAALAAYRKANQAYEAAKSSP